MEEWRPLLDFPEYIISNQGFVRRVKGTRDLSVIVNNTGTAYVSLWQEGKAHNRSLPRLVAETYLEPPPRREFNTPINLNGDGRDNRAKNLMWRPRWFAIRYHQQFIWPWNGWNGPIVLLDTGQIFPNSWTAAMTYGLINDDIVTGIANACPVWPTKHIYAPYKPHINL